MLGFLGKFRRKNIQQTKMKKILLYAFGEILLLVLGILIAVQLNNWNTNRKLTKAESITISRLYEDLKSDIRRFDFLDSAIHHHINLCDSAIQLIETQNSLQDRIDLIKLDPVDIFLLETNTATYDEMINTGRLYSLSSGKLRSWISLYYRQAKKWSAYSDGNTDRIRSAFDRPGLNDYWTIQQKLEKGIQVSTLQYPWLGQQRSDQLKEVENLMYLSRSILQKNLGNYAIIKRICQNLIEEIELYRSQNL